MSENDPDLLLMAIGNIAKARGIAEVAAESGLGRESLYKAFAPGAKPNYDTVYRVIEALGIRFTVGQ